MAEFRRWNQHREDKVFRVLVCFFLFLFPKATRDGCDGRRTFNSFNTSRSDTSQMTHESVEKVGEEALRVKVASMHEEEEDEEEEAPRERARSQFSSRFGKFNKATPCFHKSPAAGEEVLWSTSHQNHPPLPPLLHPQTVLLQEVKNNPSWRKVNLRCERIHRVLTPINDEATLRHWLLQHNSDPHPQNSRAF